MQILQNLHKGLKEVFIMASVCSVTHLSFIITHYFPGFFIYFSYGISHSSEGALIHSSPDEEPDVCKSTNTHRDAMSPEKEAFLYTKPEDGDDEDGEL